MKKEYVKPTAKLFDVRMEEKIAASCGGGSSYIFIPYGCNDQLSGGGSDCQHGTPQGS